MIDLMSRMQLKMICPAKYQENHDSKEKRQSTGTYIERCQMLAFSEKNCKATIKKCSKQAIMNSLETKEKEKISAKKLKL